MDGEAERVPPPPPPLPPAAEALGRPEKETEGVVLYDREGLEVVVGQAQGEGVTLGEGESEGEKEGETVREAEKEGRAVRLGEVECNGVREMGALLLGVRETVGQCEAVSQGEALGVSFGEEEGDWHAVGERLWESECEGERLAAPLAVLQPLREAPAAPLALKEEGDAKLLAQAEALAPRPVLDEGLAVESPSRE
jgi:hypothetical protein